MRKEAKWILILALGILALNSCETRNHSIIRENRYLANHPPEPVANYWDNVVYAVVDGATLTMDISAPEGEGPFPAIMIIHGGGWMLHTNTVMEGMSRYITNRGYVVFNINYRVLPEVKMEQIVEDCLGALVWIKEHAPQYKADPKRLAVTGDSAGGHLTAMILTQADNPIFTPSYLGKGEKNFSVSCAIPSYGVYDFISLYKLVPWMVKGFLGEPYKKAPERYKLLSPYYHIRADLPPQLVIVGDQDPLYKQNVRYMEKVREKGAEAELWVYQGQAHAFLNYFWDERGIKGYERIIEFLDQHLKK